MNLPRTSLNPRRHLPWRRVGRAVFLLLTVAGFCGCRSPLEHRRDFAIGTIRQLAERNIAVGQISVGDACQWEFHFTASGTKLSIQGPIIANYSAHCAANKTFGVLLKTVDRLRETGLEVSQFDYAITNRNFMAVSNGALTLFRSYQPKPENCCTPVPGTIQPVKVLSQSAPLQTTNQPPAIPPTPVLAK